MINRLPIDFQYEIMTYSWLDAMFSTDAFSQGFFAVCVLLAGLGFLGFTAFKLLDKKS